MINESPMKKHAILLLAATASFALLCTPRGVAFEKDTEDMGIYLDLDPDHLTYEPHETKKSRQLTLEVINRSTRTINLPVNYDGVVVTLWARSPEKPYPMSLYPPRDQKNDETIRLAPGKRHTCFSLSLTNILGDSEADARDSKWTWGWSARRKWLGTPARRYGGDGFASVVVFWAELVVDNQTLRTAPLFVPVKSD
jgi:hypothetical protein